MCVNKHTPGRPCCGCKGCCIANIAVTIGQPAPGQPGAAIGSYNWDVAAQPVVEKVAENVLGTVRQVCRQQYIAPQLSIGSFVYNAQFLSVEREIPFSYYFNVFIGGGIGNFQYWFEGSMRWRLYHFLRNVKLTVYKWGSLMRTVLSGSLMQSAQCQPAIGSRRRAYDNCTLGSDETYGEFGNLVNTSTGPCRSADFLALSHAMNTETISIQRDSGWVSGSCASIPVSDVLTPSQIFSQEYNPGASDNLCKMPLGSEFDPISDFLGVICGQDQFQQRYTYRPFGEIEAWFGVNPISIATCA